jgi:class 3 adenylate cyclase
MELMEDLDPEEARAIIDPALKLMIDAVNHYDGHIVQSTGDGIFALFGAPVAHEDHPQRALYTALRMQEQVRRYADRLRAEGRPPLQIRIGINTGEVVVRSIRTAEARSEYTPIGHTANLAARMQTLADPGSTITTESTRRLAEGYFTLRPLGLSRVKGLAEPINIYEVTGLGPLRTRLQRAAARGLTKFVGRKLEMDSLRHAAERAQTGHGQILAVMADPGVGKSRLFYEFKATSQSGWMVLEAFSVSHGKAWAYLPALEMLSAYFEIGRDDDDRRRRELILGKVLGLDRSLEDALPYLYSLLGIAAEGDSMAQMEPQTRRRRTLDAIKRILLRESLNQPLMVIFEDLHWIDSETQALLNLLVDAIANARILILVNYRPEYRHEWGGRTHYTQLRLDPLGHESAEDMLSGLVGAGHELIPLKRLIIQRTDGTPFFIEEMVQALFEEGVLERNGSVRIAPSHQARLGSRRRFRPCLRRELTGSQSRKRICCKPWRCWDVSLR